MDGAGKPAGGIQDHARLVLRPVDASGLTAVRMHCAVCPAKGSVFHLHTE